MSGRRWNGEAGRALRFAASAAVLLVAAPPSGFTQQAQPPAPDAAAYASVAEDRVVVQGLVPVPEVGEGAPIYTSADLEKMKSEARREAVQDRTTSRDCANRIPNPYADLTLEGRFFEEAELGQKIVALADRATTATRAAEDARRAAASGKGGMDAVVETELARQEVVRKLEAVRRELLEEQSVTSDLMWLMQRGGEDIDFQSELMRLAVKREQAGGVTGVRPAPEFADLHVTGVTAIQKSDRKGTFLVVTGQIVNTRKAEIPVPPLTIMAIDEQGWPLLNRTADPRNRVKIPPGGSMGFSYELRPKPGLTRTVAVTFASKSKSTMSLPAGMFEQCRKSKDTGR